MLGSRLAKSIFEDGISLGRHVLSRGKLYTVTGILAETGTDYDGMAFTPALMVELQGATARAQMFMRFETSLHFTVADASRLEQALTQLALAGSRQRTATGASSSPCRALRHLIKIGRAPPRLDPSSLN